MTPHSHSRRAIVRRSAAVLAAMLVIGGTPLVARALDDEALPSTDPALVPSISTSDVDTTATRELTESEPSMLATAAPGLVLEPATAPVAAQVADRVNQADQVVAAEASNDTAPLPALPPGPSASAWAALRECESGGDYSITNPSGKYRGAYQFDRSTWDSVAGRHIPSLVGVDPAAASPADQDALAYALYTERGARPWPHCGRHLR